MPEFTIRETGEMPYLYVERACGMAPDEISGEMGSAFHDVWAFLEKHGVRPTGPALSVYSGYDPEIMRFRAGYAIRPDDMRAADEKVRADVTPAGRVLHFLHKGPYATLREDYDAMMAHIAREGLEAGYPSWEVYLNDRTQVRDEEALLTECFMVLR